MGAALPCPLRVISPGLTRRAGEHACPTGTHLHVYGGAHGGTGERGQVTVGFNSSSVTAAGPRAMLVPPLQHLARALRPVGRPWVSGQGPWECFSDLDILSYPLERSWSPVPSHLEWWQAAGGFLSAFRVAIVCAKHIPQPKLQCEASSAWTLARPLSSAWIPAAGATESSGKPSISSQWGTWTSSKAKLTYSW